MEFSLVKVEVFIPKEYINKLRYKLNEIGALTIGGNYDNCMSYSMVLGSWRPLEGANPFNGEVGEICEAEEAKVEFCCKRELIKAVVEVVKEIHPYEVPVINVLPIINGMLIHETLD
ncbi:cutA1 divalent ion tolerance family protein [Clostridium argentinense CDC 2741]|uniref:CutA1 divalent ion tolerance family protein n=1 Tax=Clostridium argentinense CDC 2741 TaxID=1418104 RepID=A0A0C1R299_9CLOT|nr:divalent cation tolerance protein CutA [Clostridium argentinense]ARC83920.1 cytochrome C biogenesis protein [Clostridium argentinense]KIE44581.1 cutA1 divalent ion tolerance family protein [Clostridium argentinense CDC 2741]NFF41239.1 divalent cation tolerance protein CutA [Clostridium argentinense]NFP51645.1 divalent cation tolerance protein CutA [Clostridium argentinense]NFP73952.1 divalent cation tolerance protein CutA [Clostridium argentinense]